MNFLDLVKKARTIRRYKKDDVSSEFLSSLIEIASITPSAKNEQPARYIIVQNKENCEKVNECIMLSGLNYEKRQELPRMHPNAYIIICSTPNLSFFPTIDLGVIAQSMQLAAAEQNVGTCMIGAFNKAKLVNSFSEIFDECKLEPYLIMAFGYPDEIVHIMPENPEKTAYWRDDENHYVPKNTAKTNTITKI